MTEHVPASPERDRKIYELAKYGVGFPEIAAKVGLTVERIRQICTKEHARRVRVSMRNSNKGRVIDMGGDRDVDMVWTPEMQAREFGLI